MRHQRNAEDVLSHQSPEECDVHPAIQYSIVSLFCRQSPNLPMRLPRQAGRAMTSLLVHSAGNYGSKFDATRRLQRPDAATAWACSTVN
jgi:hypothetical protein